MKNLPEVTFGIIVLNGEPFTRYNLRALYPFAHQIIVAEGASPKAAHMATPDGHSIDGTLDILRRFKAEEDPEDKIIIATAEDEGHPNGFWPGEKDEQSQAYAKRATGDWLWQVDIDEFYQPEDMQRVCEYLQTHPEVTCLTFNAYHFWGGFDYVVEGGLFMSHRLAGEPWGAVRRVFKWGPGYRYVTHRPPTIVNSHGKDITRQHLRCATRLWNNHPIRMYHYFMVFRDQFTRKGAYYQELGYSWDQGRLRKNEELLRSVNLSNGLRIFDHYDTYNWLVRFSGIHPVQVENLRADIASGQVRVSLRHTEDIERLLHNPTYKQLVSRYALLETLRAIWRNSVYRIWYVPRGWIVQILRAQTPQWIIPRLPAKLQVKLSPKNQGKMQRKQQHAHRGEKNATK